MAKSSICRRRPSGQMIRKRPAGIGHGAISHKRGKELMFKRPAGKCVRGRTYTRTGPACKRPSHWCLTQRDVHSLTTRALVRRLCKIGLVFRLKACPTCGMRIKSIYDNNTYQGRCRSKGCHRWISWTCSNPLFISGHGARSIRDQLGPLLAAVIGLNVSKVTYFNGYSLSAHQLHVRLLREHLASFVEREQENISYGDGPDWEDVEVDEVLILDM